MKTADVYFHIIYIIWLNLNYCFIVFADVDLLHTCLEIISLRILLTCFWQTSTGKEIIVRSCNSWRVYSSEGMFHMLYQNYYCWYLLLYARWSKILTKMRIFHMSDYHLSMISTFSSCFVHTHICKKPNVLQETLKTEKTCPLLYY